MELEKTLIIIGSSGHARVITDALELSGSFTSVGYLDDTVAPGASRGNYPVLGAISDAPEIFSRQQITRAAIAIGDNWSRRSIAIRLKQLIPDLRFPVVRHPSAIVAASAQIADGTVLLAGSHVGPGSRVGAFCILNTGSSLDHDCMAADFSSFAPGVFAGGGVTIGECSAIGVGAAISDRISIGSHTVIGTGSVVVRDIPDLVVAYGNPAIPKRSRRPEEAYTGIRPSTGA